MFKASYMHLYEYIIVFIMFNLCADRCTFITHKSNNTVKILLKHHDFV